MLHSIPVVIMAGGRGERMRPFSDILPKPLLAYHGKPLIENVVQQFYEKGFRRFYFVLCNQGPLIAAYLSSINLNCEMLFIHEEFPMGTVGGLWLMRDELEKDFILCNCDNLGDFNYYQAIEFHQTEQAEITMFVKRENYVIPFGLVHTEGKTHVLSVEEKPVFSSYISTGVYVVNSAVVIRFLNGSRMDMPALVNQVSTEGKVCFFDIGDAQWTDMSLSSSSIDKT